MANKALFISVNDLKKKSILDGNIDGDKVIQFIEVAQDTHIQIYLGGNLYAKLQTLILDGTIDDVGNAKYKALLNTYIKPMLIWFTQASYIPFAAYDISNSGITKGRSENNDSITPQELDKLVSKVSDLAEFYTRRFVDYMCDNTNDFPEYTTSEDGQMYPDRDVNYTSWVL